DGDDPAARRGWDTARAGCRRRQALAGAARRAHGRRERACRFRILELARLVRAGPHAARHRQRCPATCQGSLGRARRARSLAYVAAARHVYVVVEDPNVEGRRLFVKAKNNLAPDKAALPYVIGLNTRVGHDEAAGTDISAPYIIWGNELVTVTANEAMHAAAIGGRLASVKREAEEFLRDRLADGRKVKTADLEEEAEAHGISKSTLKRARKELGV